MAEQKLTMRANADFVIETPLGLIRLRRGSKRDRVVLRLPDGMQAYLGDDRALEHARFIELDADGKIRPKHRFLGAQAADDGESINLAPVAVAGPAVVQRRTIPALRAAVALGASGG